MTRPVAHPLNAEPVNQTISEGSMLAVLAERSCDMGMIGYEMTLLAARFGYMLTPGRRPTPPGPPDRARP
jgi:hypothetical protein